MPGEGPPRVGKSRLYIDYVRTLCEMVLKLGKRPVLWADIALKYPEAIPLLPKEAIFVDWCYSPRLHLFDESHNKLLASGCEIWGAPALRSHPDNFFLTDWEGHFNNLRAFIPQARQRGYKGMIMTSWSTSGQYSYVWESGSDPLQLLPIRHVYPITGFNILLAAYAEGLKSEQSLDIPRFMETYCRGHYGLSSNRSDLFWSSLKAAPFEVNNGLVKSSPVRSLEALLEEARAAAKTLHELAPTPPNPEFEHYSLMADIRVYHLSYLLIQKQVNAATCSAAQIPGALSQLQELMATEKELERRFLALNGASFYTSELEQENQLRCAKTHMLYERLARLR